MGKNKVTDSDEENTPHPEWEIRDEAEFEPQKYLSRLDKELDAAEAIKYFGVPRILDEIGVDDCVDYFGEDYILDEIGEGKIEDYLGETMKHEAKESEHPSECPFDFKDESEWDKFQFPASFSTEDEQQQEVLTASIQKTPALGRRIRINVTKRKGFTKAEMIRHVSACKLTEIVLNSAEFKKRIYAKKFSTTKKSSKQIYDHIMTGEETLQKGKDYEFDVEVEMYYEKSNIVGYTYGSVTWTRLNRYVTADYDESGIAGNLVHEWLHKAGYGHSSASDHSSVPYAVGYMVRDMIKEYKKGARWVDLYPEVISTPIGIASDDTPINVKIPLPAKEPVKTCHRPFWPYFWTKEICYYS